MSSRAQMDLLENCRTGAGSTDTGVQRRLYWEMVDGLAQVDLQNDEGFGVIHAAVVNVRILQDLLSRGANVNLTSKAGWTALSLAAQRGAVDSLHVLLTAGADPEIVDSKFGNGPLWFVTMRKWAMDCIPALIAHGADPDRVNRAGKSPRALVHEMIAIAGPNSSVDRQAYLDAMDRGE